MGAELLNTADKPLLILLRMNQPAKDGEILKGGSRDGFVVTCDPIAIWLAQWRNQVQLN